MILEVKGRLTGADRVKMKAVKELHPTLDIRLVFDKNNKLNKKSTTRYSDWADSIGMKWCLVGDLKEWLT